MTVYSLGGRSEIAAPVDKLRAQSRPVVRGRQSRTYILALFCAIRKYNYTNLSVNVDL